MERVSTNPTRSEVKIEGKDGTTGSNPFNDFVTLANKLVSVPKEEAEAGKSAEKTA